MAYRAISRSLATILMILSLIIIPFVNVAQGPDDTCQEQELTFPQPSKPTGFGPYPRGYIDVMIPRPPVQDVAARIYYPAETTGAGAAKNMSAAPWPTVVFIAGGMDALTYCNGISERISSWGFVVVNVELGNTYGAGTLRNPYTMAAETTDVIDYIENQTINATFPLYGMMDKGRLAVSGHSWGGAASGLAATDSYGDPRFKVSAPISATPIANPTDYSKDIHIPLLLMTGSSGDNSLKSLFDASNPPTTYIIVIGATHGGILGHQHWVVAFLKYWLYNETDYEYWTYTDGIRAEDDAGSINFFSNLFWAKGILSGTEIDEDGTVDFLVEFEGMIHGNVSREWDFDGGGYDWTSNTSNSTQHTYPKKGHFEPRLRVRDRYETKNLNFELNVSNVPPVPVTSDNVTIIEDGTAFFSAEGSYDTPSDNGALEFKWDFGNGEGTDYSTELEANQTYTEQGTYIVNLTVRDDDQDEVSANITVVVNNLAPTAEAGDDIACDEDEGIDLVGSGNDTPTDLAAGLEYRWDYGEGNGTDWGKDPKASYTYTTAGDFTVTFHVRDQDGNVTTDTLVVSVSNLAPDGAITSPVSGEAFQKDSEVEFQAFGDDTPTDLPWLEYQWDFGDGTILPWGGQTVVTHIFTKGGEYNVTFSVRDPDGNVTVAIRDITIINDPPVITVEEPDKELEIDEDGKVEFKAKVTDTASDIEDLTVKWSIDGNEFDGEETSYTFTRSGMYDVVVRAADPEGATAEEAIRVVVKNKAPSAQVTISPLTLEVGEAINYTATITDTASDQGTLKASWDFGDGIGNGTDLSGVYTYTKAGTFTVVFKVTDDDGSEDVVRTTVTVKEKFVPPPPDDDDDGANLSVVLAAAGGVIAVIIVLLVVLLFMRSRKGGPERNMMEDGPDDHMGVKGPEGPADGSLSEKGTQKAEADGPETEGPADTQPVAGQLER